MNKRSRATEVAKYQGLTPKQFANEIGMSEEHIRRMIRDLEAGAPHAFFRRGEVINVARNPTKSRQYRISADALARFLDERSVA